MGWGVTVFIVEICIMSPHQRGEGHIVLDADPIGVGICMCRHWPDTFLSEQHLVNQLLDSYQIFIDIIGT